MQPIVTVRLAPLRGHIAFTPACPNAHLPTVFFASISPPNHVPSDTRSFQVAQIFLRSSRSFTFFASFNFQKLFFLTPTSFQFVHSLIFSHFITIFRRYLMWAGLTYSILDSWSCPLGRTSLQSSRRSQRLKAAGMVPTKVSSMNGEEATGIGSALHTTRHPLPCTRKRPVMSFP